MKQSVKWCCASLFLSWKDVHRIVLKVTKHYIWYDISRQGFARVYIKELSMTESGCWAYEWILCSLCFVFWFFCTEHNCFIINKKILEISLLYISSFQINHSFSLRAISFLRRWKLGVEVCKKPSPTKSSYSLFNFVGWKRRAIRGEKCLKVSILVENIGGKKRHWSRPRWNCYKYVHEVENHSLY